MTSYWLAYIAIALLLLPLTYKFTGVRSHSEEGLAGAWTMAIFWPVTLPALLIGIVLVWVIYGIHRTVMWVRSRYGS